MEEFEHFEFLLNELLAHLYDPIYRPPDQLWQFLNVDRGQGLPGLQRCIVEGIESLKPASSVPVGVRSWRIYKMLAYRYIQNLTQEEIADRLQITARHLRRERPEAVHALALALWEKSGRVLQSEIVTTFVEGETPESEWAEVERLSDWQSQLKQDLSALQETMLGSVADVPETLQRTVRVISPLLSQRNIHLKFDMLPTCLAAIHSSALRQVLISAMEQMAQYMPPGELRVSIATEDSMVHITLEGHIAADIELSLGEPIQEIINMQGGSCQVLQCGPLTCLTIRLPHVDRSVLVVDDNMNMVHLYRRYTAGTRYHIIHVSQAEQVIEQARILQPSAIILDVMLPDADGWELLSHLHENPATAEIPVVICTVLHEKELAFALGAANYITKPVQRQAFLDVLNQVFS